MLFSSTGVGPTFTVPLTLPLTRCGAPGGNKTTFSFEEGTMLFTRTQNASLSVYLQVDSGVRFHRNQTGSGSSSRWGSRSSMHSGSTAAGTCKRKEQWPSSRCWSFTCYLVSVTFTYPTGSNIKTIEKMYYHFISFGHVLLVARKREKNTISLSSVPLQFFSGQFPLKILI